MQQAVPLSARKATGGSSEGIASFLQLPHFSEAVVKKIARKVSLKLLAGMLQLNISPSREPDLIELSAAFASMVEIL